MNIKVYFNFVEYASGWLSCVQICLTCLQFWIFDIPENKLLFAFLLIGVIILVCSVFSLQQIKVDFYIITTNATRNTSGRDLYYIATYDIIIKVDLCLEHDYKCACMVKQLATAVL